MSKRLRLAYRFWGDLVPRAPFEGPQRVRPLTETCILVFATGAALAALTGCGASEAAETVEPLPWWVLFGSGLMVTAIALYFLKEANSPEVTVSGPPGLSPRTIVICMIIFGILIAILGVIGAFVPGVLSWVSLYSETYETTGAAWEIVVFLVIQIVIVIVVISGLARSISAREWPERAALIASLIWVGLTVAYCYWIHVTDRIGELLEPFEKIWNLVFG
jgi:hypothetical protein